MAKKRVNGTVSAAVICTLVVAGCATPGGSGTGVAGDQQTSECNPIVLAVIGGVMCNLASKKGHKTTNTAVCAALAGFACYAFNNYKASQVKTAKEVSDDYLRTNRSLPDRPMVTNYVTRVDPSRANVGGNVHADTDITVVPGRQGGPTSIQEEWIMVDATGEKWLGPKKKPVNSSQKEGGQYKGGFDLKLANELPQGQYEFRSVLYVDGQPVKGAANRVQVTVTDSGIRLAQVAE